MGNRGCVVVRMGNGHWAIVPESGHGNLPTQAAFRGQPVFAVVLK